jgi:hypothetical protein
MWRQIQVPPTTDSPWINPVGEYDMLRWYRSWPSVFASDVPADRPHVIDNLPRLLVSDYDYATVAEWPSEGPGICLLEWDVALDERQRTQFAGLALLEPERVLAAPYLIGNTHICRVGNDPVQPPATECATFGLGCTYLPYEAVRGFLSGGLTNRFTDTEFSFWYRDHVGPARVTWDIHPQHLHPYMDWSQ